MFIWKKKIRFLFSPVFVSFSRQTNWLNPKLLVICPAAILPRNQKSIFNRLFTYSFLNWKSLIYWQWEIYKERELTVKLNEACTAELSGLIRFNFNLEFLFSKFSRIRLDQKKIVKNDSFCADQEKSVYKCIQHNKAVALVYSSSRRWIINQSNIVCSQYIFVSFSRLTI